METRTFAYEQKLEAFKHQLRIEDKQPYFKYAENEIYDVTFEFPFNCIMSGSSGSGKTARLLEFLQSKDVICNAKF